MADHSFNMPLIFGGSDNLILAGTNSAAFPAEVSVVGSSNISLSTAGSWLTGGTGSDVVITGAGLFGALDTYDGAASNGAAGLMLFMSAWANAGNNGFAGRIRECSDGQIDIAEPYFTFPATKVTEAAASPTIKVGRAVRDFNGALQYWTGLAENTDIGTAEFHHVLSLFASQLQYSWAGVAAVTVQTDFVGGTPQPIASANPVAAGFGSLDLSNAFISSGGDIQNIYLTTQTPGSAEGHELAGDNSTTFNICTGFTYTHPTGAAPVVDVAGRTSPPGGRRGVAQASGTLALTHIDQALAIAISTLGDPSGRERIGVDVIMTDVDGNDIVLGVLRAEPDQWMPGGDPPSGPLAFNGMLSAGPNPEQERSFVHQDFT
jgi:hypothetical protein